MNIQTANGKSFINNKPLVNKYSISLKSNPSNENNVRFSVSISNIEVFSCDYKNVVIDNRDSDLLVVNAPNFYGEFSDDNCVDISYDNLINSLSYSGKLVIKDEVLTNPYTVLLQADGGFTGAYYLSIQQDRGTGGGVEEIASVSYTNMLIDGSDLTKTIISSPTFYAELTANNCADFGYTFITNALR
jgi:hypothetical protein